MCRHPPTTSIFCADLYECKDLGCKLCTDHQATHNQHQSCHRCKHLAHECHLDIGAEESACAVSHAAEMFGRKLSMKDAYLFSLIPELLPYRYNLFLSL
jgi:hypothetical protein